MVHEVADSLSNTPEHLEQAARAIGRSDVKRRVFDAIYHHKAKVKSVDEIAKRTRLTRMRVLQAGRFLATRHIVRQTTKDGQTAYEKIDFFHAHKKKVLRLAASKTLLAKLQTKRNPTVSVNVKMKTVKIATSTASVDLVTIDDIASFARVRKVKADGHLPASLSETQFKRGVQKIVGEPGEFKDWGGEQSDLYTTRLRVGGKRIAAAFAFKGPGLKKKLVPGNMGKNGDQALRLFQEPAEVFLVQHWREIDASVVKQMHSLALAKSAMSGKKIQYGIIDGVDSMRLYRAYARSFGVVKQPKNARR